jgi:S1-C subfamily serine protease
MLEKCPVIQGNSGSPALNLAGDVIGVVWGATALDIDSSLSFSVRRSLDEFAAVTEMFHFSSYAL